MAEEFYKNALCDVVLSTVATEENALDLMTGWATDEDAARGLADILKAEFQRLSLKCGEPTFFECIQGVGRKSFLVEHLYASDDPVPDSPHDYVEVDYKSCNLVSSLCEDGLHRLAIDVDREVVGVDGRDDFWIVNGPRSVFPGDKLTIIPSSTEGHFHVYGTKGYEWEEYEALLESAMMRGVISGGYKRFSIRDGMSTLRPPWVKKTRDQGPEITAAIQRALYGTDAKPYDEELPF